MKRRVTVADVGEGGLLRTFRRKLGRSRAKGVLLGVGDDAAVLHAVGPGAVLTTDTLVEEVDFRLSWASWRDLGHKAAAVNLSDLAAMGAQPRALLLNLGLRASDRVADVLALVDRLNRTGMDYGAPLIGGDLSATSGPLVVGVTAVGQVEPARMLCRHRGRVGDRVLVSGTLGGAALGLAMLENGSNRPVSAVRRQLRPTPRVRLGAALAGIARAAADVSDGLSRDVLHLAAGVRLDAAALPMTATVRKAAQQAGLDPIGLALQGGEDFELVVAVAPARLKAAHRAAAKAGTALTEIGRVRATQGLQVDGYEGPLAAFEHFRSLPIV